MAEPGTTASAPPGRSNSIAWLAVAVALSPVLVDSAQHALREPWARPALLFALLLILRAWKSEREVPRAPWTGFAIALLAALAGAALAAADWPRFGRLAIPVCVLGMSVRTGRPTLGIAGIALWCLPPPSLLLESASPGLETAWGTLAQLITPADWRFPFELRPEDGGVALAWWLAGSGYVRALELNRGGLSALPLCLAGALAAFPIQFAAIVAVLAVSGDSTDLWVAPATAAWLLREALPLAAVAIALLLAPWRPHLHLHRYSAGSSR